MMEKQPSEFTKLKVALRSESAAALMLPVLQKANATMTKVIWRKSLIDFYFERDGKCYRLTLIRGQLVTRNILDQALPCDHPLWKEVNS